MRTVFKDCFLVNFAVRPDAMRRLVPRSLELDLYKGEAYLSVVIADMVRMRPAFLPPALGVSYTQVVYRVVVRFGQERGVYFIRSDADNRLMAVLGDWFTFFRFHYAHVSWDRSQRVVGFELRGTPAGAADIRARFGTGADSRLVESAFRNLDEARSFLVELFVAFGIERRDRVRAVRIRRGAWDVSVVRDEIADYRFMGSAGPFGPEPARLDSVFHVRDVPYHWFRLGRSQAPV